MRLNSTLAAAALALAIAFTPVIAGQTDPLFVNLTSQDPHRVTMALTFSVKQQERKHPVSVYLNDRAVLVGAKGKAAEFAEQQKLLKSIMAAGGEVYICPMCMKHYGVAEGDLLEGVKIGSPDAVGALLFKDNGKTLSW